MEDLERATGPGYGLLTLVLVQVSSAPTAESVLVTQRRRGTRSTRPRTKRSERIRWLVPQATLAQQPAHGS